jgi:hypothetical protein
MQIEIDTAPCIALRYNQVNRTAVCELFVPFTLFDDYQYFVDLRQFEANTLDQIVGLTRIQL